jgi:hypothetical protein
MKKAVLFALIMVCGLSATGVLIALTVFPSVAEASPVYLVVRTKEDINRIWLLSGVSGSLTKVLLSEDLFPVNYWGYLYNTTILLDLAHTGRNANYCFDYEQRTIPESQVMLLETNGFTVCYNYSSDTSLASAFPTGALQFSSVTGSGKWALLRETMFIFDRDCSEPSRWEQVYRGPDGQLYLFRIAYGPQLFRLSDMMAQGFTLYNPADFANAAEICGKVPLQQVPMPLQPSPIQKRLNPIQKVP